MLTAIASADGTTRASIPVTALACTATRVAAGRVLVRLGLTRLTERGGRASAAPPPPPCSPRFCRPCASRCAPAS